MWEKLPINQKENYKKLILAFASLTKVFSQKNDDNTIPTPIVNSKFQETAFQKSFNSVVEDTSNTSYDASLSEKNEKGEIIKYLIGIKTFGLSTEDQKVAQFKANSGEWREIIDQIDKNSKNNRIEENKSLYLDLAKRIAKIRNVRIASSIENLKGFSIDENEDKVEAIYHVLMTSKKDNQPMIYVGETSYDKIDIDNIEIIGSTTPNNPTNFIFTDNRHKYKYTSADSQLLMFFDNENIKKEAWNVIYAPDAYSVFFDIAQKIYGNEDLKIAESCIWPIKVEPFSGFNNFYGLGSKIAIDKREHFINKLFENYSGIINKEKLDKILNLLRDFLINNQGQTEEIKSRKIDIRNNILNILKDINNKTFNCDVKKLIFRPKDEIYIPIPDSKKFHNANPNFFGENIGTFKEDGKTLKLPPEKRQFNLVFEPSGKIIPSFITQDSGKGIESVEKQSFLGEWLLRKVFQLEEYEPLTENKLKEVGINGIKLFKYVKSPDVHLEFIWID